MEFASSNMTQDDSVLRDVLDELDRERSQRAELEAKVRALLQNESNKLSVSASSQGVSLKDWTALKTEKEGLNELLDTLLGDQPAFQAATKSSSSLPLHALRLLEIMPWDSRARQHALCTEQLYEWQVYTKNQWVHNIRQFPQHFKSLPIVKPKAGEEPNPKRKGIFGDMTSPPKHVVLTDANLTHVLNINDGYPLPTDGATWDWVTGWRVDKHVSVVEKERTMDCDNEGWSYACEPTDFSTRELCWDRASNEKGEVIRPYRRRRWTRRRVLVSYPYASQRTREYLRLLGENVRLGDSVTKLSDQLVQTKTSLTETEAALLEANEKHRKEKEAMIAKVQGAEEFYRELGLEEGGDDSSFIRSKLLHVENLGKEKLEMFQSRMRASSWNGSNDEDAGTPMSDKDIDGDQKFSWRLGRSGLIDQIKKSPNLLPLRTLSREDSGRVGVAGSSSARKETEKGPILLLDERSKPKAKNASHSKNKD